jgi:hypothetical protein
MYLTTHELVILAEARIQTNLPIRSNARNLLAPRRRCDPPAFNLTKPHKSAILRFNQNLLNPGKQKSRLNNYFS